MQPSVSEFPPHVTERQQMLLGWPTDTLAVDYYYTYVCDDDQKHDDGEAKDTPEVPHTLLVFFPGNPGQYDWYVPDLCQLVQRLGRGFAARAVSHAGHSLKRPTNDVGAGTNKDVGITAVTAADDDNDDSGILNVTEYAQRNPDAHPSIPWTIQGQVQHKCAYMDLILAEFDDADDTTNAAATSSSSPPLPNVIFLGHSFGCHLVQQVCLLRPKILQRTIGFVHIMPFIRMQAAAAWDQAKLDWGAQHPHTLISVGTMVAKGYRTLPKAWVNALVKLFTSVQDARSRAIAVRLLRQPNFVRNFFELGTEEIRDIPRHIDIQTLNILSKSRPMFMLFAGQDQWAPSFHMTDIARLQAQHDLSPNIFMTHLRELRHDYVSHEGMPSQVVGWCHQCISSIAMNQAAMSLGGMEGKSQPCSLRPRSRL